VDLSVVKRNGNDFGQVSFVTEKRRLRMIALRSRESVTCSTRLKGTFEKDHFAEK